MSAETTIAPKRIALVHPAAPEDDPFARIGRSDIPPLGVLYLAAALEQAGHAVRVYDLNHHPGGAALVNELQSLRPDVVGLGTLAASLKQTLALAGRLRNDLSHDFTLLAGGPDATVQPATYLQADVFDAVLIGEAEHTLPRLCDALPKIEPGDGVLIPGHTNARRPAQIDPDQAPFPARHLLPLKAYRGGPAYKRQRTTTSIFTHRGCPYHCTFCEKGVHEGAIRYRSAPSIFAEIQQIIHRHGIRDIRFIDDVLMVNRDVLEQFIDLVLKHNERFDWLCTGRVDLMDESLLRRMKQGGCYRIELGVESGSEQILSHVEKNFAPDDALAAVKKARRAGIEVIANFILGLPQEDETDMRKTVDFALRLEPDYAIYFLFTPFIGSPITKQHDLPWDAAAPGFRGPSPTYLVPTPRVQQLINQAYSRFYFRPGYIWRRLKAIRSGWVVWDLARMALAFLGGRFKRRRG